MIDRMVSQIDCSLIAQLFSSMIIEIVAMVSVLRVLLALDRSLSFINDLNIESNNFQMDG